MQGCLEERNQETRSLEARNEKKKRCGKLQTATEKLKV